MVVDSVLWELIFWYSKKKKKILISITVYHKLGGKQ